MAMSIIMLLFFEAE